uniref:Uncharacterized protein n=1 Tax=Romanomermis culicivorax TaxID=13658 RepID=A0A915J6P1_ROMCU
MIQFNARNDLVRSFNDRIIHRITKKIQNLLRQSSQFDGHLEIAASKTPAEKTRKLKKGERTLENEPFQLLFPKQKKKIRSQKLKKNMVMMMMMFTCRRQKKANIKIDRVLRIFEFYI